MNCAGSKVGDYRGGELKRPYRNTCIFSITVVGH